jgi:putative phage-type endonuclease
MDRQEWLERRRKGIGGTDAAAILGLSKYRTPVDVWEEKTGRRPMELTETEPMKWGLRLEDAIAAAYSEQTGRRVRKTPLRRHPKHPIILGSPDRIVFGDIRYGPEKLLEIKTTRSDDDYAPRGGELDVEPEKRIPAMHYVQVQHYLGITGIGEADVAVLFGGSDFRIYPIPRDDAFIADLFDEVLEWWAEYVVADKEPPIGPDDGKYLARKYPRDTTEEIVATSEVALQIDALLALKDRIAVLERDSDELANGVKDYMGDAGRLVVPGAKVTWKASDRTTVGWKEVAGAYRKRILELVPLVVSAPPAVPYEEELDAIESVYTQTTTVRSFRINRSKEAS